ncbi:peptidoglycan-binding protein [Streptomyces sp. x-19]|uniref:peptidoglycan-binding protein n=1 Tax=Streptomyces sp. x-19 TaxID=2789280 RepID=UPI00397F4CF3
MEEQFTSGTADAVKRWQKAHGLKQTGEIGLDQVAFEPGSVRVKKKEAAVGDQTAPGRPVLSTTRSGREVQIKRDAAEANLAKPGTRVDTTLPDGVRVKGKVVSTDRNVDSGDGKDQGGQGEAKVTARVTLTDPGGGDGLDQAPVSVDIEGETRQNVLTVPVNALLALFAGGFGVQVVEHGAACEVPVKPGIFG